MNDVRIYLIGDGLVTPNNIIFGDDLTLAREMEGGQRFFRTKITGKIKFNGSNFDQIASSDPNFKWQVSYYLFERGTETHLANGYFYKYDCTFDYDNKVCEVEPIVEDNYTKLLAGLDKVYNIVELAPETEAVQVTKNYAFQFYTPDDNKLTIAIGGAYFDVSCTEKSRDDLPSLHFDQIFARYCFSLSKSNFTDGFIARHPNVFGIYNGTQYVLGDYTLDGTNYVIRVEDDNGWANIYLLDTGDSPETIIATGRSMWTEPGGVMAFAWQEDYYGVVSRSSIFNEWVEMWGRVICPKGNSHTYDIPTDDITERNLNYTKCVGINYFLQHAGAPSVVFGKYFIFSSESQLSPTKWGKTKNGDYFVKPQRDYYPVVPLGQTFWGVVSMWFWFPRFSGMSSYSDVVTIKDTYPLYSVISRLLEKVDSSISFGNSVNYSELLFSVNNPITGKANGHYLLAPITNIKSSYYSSPAQRGDISLSTIFDMLKKMFQCYWFIDSNKRLRIEHISWFKEGGYYGINDTPSYSILSDLTSHLCPITQKPWSFGINKVGYDKKSAPNRYEFGFADKSTDPFNGYAIDIKDEAVADCSKEDCTLSAINTDVDMILSSPSAFNDDTLAFLHSREGKVYTPDGISYRGSEYAPKYYIQNGFLSFFYLEQYYYSQDLGGMNVVIDGIGALSPMFPRDRALKRIKTQSGVVTPLLLADALGNGSIKTDIGIGEFHKLEWNLQSKVATLELFFAPN